ncbi:hypothetical protein [Chitinophaga ginsengisoli]|uniref:Uncharacterized protein n=1 Tax=Chitinophaga ginsengisoli TaxID=363837 RepID=A0A2P8FRR9_9BACT|nr:hypothetical protein [Chitinophaga ginsengisoli]PSL24428.1 hypothetical protein CLV42_11514 [Chitinophaga ginsengisoli]
MKKFLFCLSAALLLVGATYAQDKATREAKQSANRELNREIRVGKNEGNDSKVRDAREAKEQVKEAKTPERVREVVKEYRAGNNTPSEKPADRKPF